MGRVSRNYDEAELCPMMMPEAYWYALPSQTRTRIRKETGLEPTAGVYIGSVQDRLIALGLGRLANTFMATMQEAHDRAAADERRFHIIDAPERLPGIGLND